jgi:hypothetical protein
MLHLVVLVMADLWAIDPTIAKAPPSQIAQKLFGASEASGSALDASKALGPNPVKVCTYGAPQLGPHLWSNATGLARTFTTPSCDDETTNFESGFASQSLMGAFPFGIGPLWGPAFSRGIAEPIGQMEPVVSRSAPSVPVHYGGPSNIVVGLPHGERGSSGTFSSASSHGHVPIYRPSR